jgi:hypothetical protein
MNRTAELGVLRHKQMNLPKRNLFPTAGSLLSVLMVSLLLWSCSPSNTALVGKWQEQGDPSVTEFRADGTFVIHLGEKLTGKYKSAGKEHIKLSFDGVVGKVVGESTWKTVVQGDNLELTDPDGNKSRFQRVK